MGTREFCEHFVEAVGKEAGPWLLTYTSPLNLSSPSGFHGIVDHVQMTALTRALKTDVNVAYLDGRSPSGKVDFVEFRDPDSQLGNSSPITLLYR